MMNSLRNFILFLVLGFCAQGMAKDVKDTLFSPSGDRIIVNYSIQHSGGQVTLRFQGVQKKLGSKNLEKYKKLDEVAVVMFDRSGNYKDMKFDGMAPDAFMVPSNLNYSRSSDGYFLLQDEPSMQFSVTSGNKAQLSIPLYLAHYEGKRHYKVFAKCGNLQLSSTSGGQRKGGGGAGGGGAMMGGDDEGGGFETVATTTEEVIADEGISPAEEASIRINSIISMLERATKLPLSEDLTNEVKMLRELRFKITDPEITSKINQALEAYEAKKQEMEEKADAAAQAAADEEKQQQARNDSLSNVSMLQQAKEKKDLMYLIGGVAIVVLLFSGVKQIMKMVKEHKQAKQQKEMMEKIQKMSNPLADQKPAPEEPKPHTMSKEAEAAKQRLMELRKGKTSGTGASTGKSSDSGIVITPRKQSLNDVIPAKYKRWRKPGQDKNEKNS